MEVNEFGYLLNSNSNDLNLDHEQYYKEYMGREAIIG